MFRSPHNPTAYDDDWEDQPGQGFFYQWGLGLVLPAAIIACAACAVLLGRVAIGRQALLLHGANALALGLAGISLGVFLHCHYFWGNIYNQAWFAVLGKIVAAGGFIAGLGILILRVGVPGLT